MLFSARKAPVFVETSTSLELRVGQPVTLTFKATSLIPVTFTTTITRDVNVVLLSASREGAYNGTQSAEYTAAWDWMPTQRSVISMLVSADNGLTTELKPLLRLCDCQNGGTCDYTVGHVSVQRHTLCHMQLLWNQESWVASPHGHE